MLRNFAYAWRVLRRSPGFSIMAVATIALGISACTAIFSVANAVLFRPLPYFKPDRLVLACGDLVKRGVRDWPFSNADFFDLRNGGKELFEGFAAFRTDRAVLVKEDGTPERVSFGLVTPNFFQLLGAKAVAGRDFNESDGEPPPPPPAGTVATNQPRVPQMVIISHAYWQRRYGGNPQMIGSTVPNVGQIVGVLEPGFELLMPPAMNVEHTPEIWFAARLSYDEANRNNVAYQVIGRMKPGVTIQQAQAVADEVSEVSRRANTISNTAGYRVRIEPLHQYVSAEVNPALRLLMGAAGFLMLIACANVANLLLVRTSQRERELAVRSALGAGARQIVWQLLAESVLLAAAGTLLGVGLAWVGIRQLLAIAPANLPRAESISIDPLVLGFTALLGLAASVVFGLVPSMRASRPAVIDVLRSSGRSAGLAGGSLLRNGVVVAEVAMAFVLLIGSGLMIRSFIALQQVDPGFDSQRLLTFQMLGLRTGDTPEQRAATLRDVQRRLAAIPGVQSVAGANALQLASSFFPIRWGTEAALADATKFQATDNMLVLPGYFEAMRIKLIAGRTFTEDDNMPNRTNIIVDQVMAQKAFPGESAVGKRILVRLRRREPEWLTIVGVVAHQRTSSLVEYGREQIFVPDGYIGHGAITQWALRTSGPPARLAEAVREEMRKLSPRILLAEVQPMEFHVERAKTKTRFTLLLMGVLASVAALLAAVGLFGVMSTVVRQRTAEIGVRLAVGADAAGIFRMMISRGLVLSGIGMVVGLVSAFGLTRLMSSMLVGVSATDPLTYGAMIAAFLVIAALASWIPARRAATLNPVAALRED